MDFTYFRLLSVGGILVVGLLAVAGVMAASFLATWLTEAGLAVAARLGRLQGRAEGAKPPVARRLRC